MAGWSRRLALLLAVVLAIFPALSLAAAAHGYDFGPTSSPANHAHMHGALEHAGARVSLSGDAAEIERAARVVLPGVGAFADCMAGLKALPGMIEALARNVIERGKPFLGICVGMQLMARRGIEHGTHDGLGWLDAEVRPIEPADPALKVPHMGWNELEIASRHPLLDGIEPGAHAYFVHSFAMRCADPKSVIARVDYGGPLVGGAGGGNPVGTPFHPEKSQAVGPPTPRHLLPWPA